MKRLSALPALAALAVAPATLAAVSADAAARPRLQVSKTTGLKDGDQITVSASGFTRTGQSPLGLCKPPAAGLDDCELAAPHAYMGQVADGRWTSSDGKSSVRVTIKKNVKGTDCTARPGACVVGVTLIGVSGADRTANTAMVPLTIGQGSGGGVDGGGGNGNGNGNGNGSGNGSGDGDDRKLPHTGSPDGVPTYALVASALVMGGSAALLIIPRRRRRAS
ncbi:neocarzinostatin apoprotein domain-containing protein [Actinomadura kijaniata]|uniref:neocarzinostatin apoprotein domain-containing protein n=1 Tax=Actinomadura kijaniata TaxID=46161 RepID=UPI00082C65F2|nr:neocarzinostatin apoprotein domain-containing protein [Actinomadura kijaniata]